MIEFRSPGRVNLIGEHTDYNGGYVLPCALNLGLTGSTRLLDNTISESRFTSVQFGNSGSWLEYPKAVIAEFDKLGLNVPPFELHINGDLPDGVGLSSSAALELLVASVINSQLPSDARLSRLELAYLCQRAEHAVGINCGIMDQFTVAMGKRDHAILLNCKTMKYRYIPLELGDYSLVIVNSNVKHSLASSKYNERRDECFNSTNPMHLKRMKHVNSENERVLAAAEALESGRLTAFGTLMNQSHISMRDDYEISCFEIDTLVETAWNFDGCIGSRMTGGGFGGCTINLVESLKTDEFIKVIGEKYLSITGRSATFYTVTTDDGTRMINND